MLELHKEQRAVIVDTLREAGNIVLGGLVVGQFFAGQPFSIALAMAGTMTWLTLFVLNIGVARRSK